MNLRQMKRLAAELSEYIESMLAGMGRIERVAALRSYLTGLLLDGDRKSIEPMASRLVDDASDIEAMRQRLQQAVTIATWSDTEMLARLSRKLDAELPGVEALVIDDTGFPKKGKHSVGVARQYSGTLGRVDNCQVAVSLHLAGESRSGCVAMDLYLPDEWTSDEVRMDAAGVPKQVAFRTKLEIALAQLDAALTAGVRKHVVLADPGYGDASGFREELGKRGLRYVVGVNGEPVVWAPESNPRIPRKPKGAEGRPPTRFRDEKNPPETVKSLAARLSYRKVTWREGSHGWQSSRFAAVRIRTAHRHIEGHPPGPEQWLLAEWPEAEKKPRKYWLSTLPPDTSVKTLVRFAKLRWRVERDYQEMKQEVGLDHFEGRTWRGFHHHVTLCAVAHGFLALRRALSPPEHDELDAADGPQSPTGGPDPADRQLSALQAHHRSERAARRSVEDVIKSY
jgi:SRSO17 transposase